MAARPRLCAPPTDGGRPEAAGYEGGPGAGSIVAAAAARWRGRRLQSSSASAATRLLVRRTTTFATMTTLLRRESPPRVVRAPPRRRRRTKTRFASRRVPPRVSTRRSGESPRLAATPSARVATRRCPNARRLRPRMRARHPHTASARAARRSVPVGARRGGRDARREENATRAERVLGAVGGADGESRLFQLGARVQDVRETLLGERVHRTRARIANTLRAPRRE